MLRYLCGTVGYGLRYTADSDMQLVGYTDSDWAGSIEDRRVLSGVASVWDLLLFPGSAGSRPL